MNKNKNSFRVKQYFTPYFNQKQYICSKLFYNETRFFQLSSADLAFRLWF